MLVFERVMLAYAQNEKFGEMSSEMCYLHLKDLMLQNKLKVHWGTFFLSMRLLLI